MNLIDQRINALERIVQAQQVQLTQLIEIVGSLSGVVGQVSTFTVDQSKALARVVKTVDAQPWLVQQ